LEKIQQGVRSPRVTWGSSTNAFANCSEAIIQGACRVTRALTQQSITTASWRLLDSNPRSSCPSPNRGLGTTDMKMRIIYGSWEGDPTILARYEDGRMYAFIDYGGGWIEAHAIDVFTKAAVIGQHIFEYRYL
jgi:hypothetical protein